VAALLDRIATSAPPLVWLDDEAYVARLLGGGRTPWLNAAELIALRRKANGLLRTQVTQLSLSAVIDACVAADVGLLESMRTKKRAIAPLRTLLGDSSVRGKLLEIARALRSTFPAVPFLLTLPSPRNWVTQAYRCAFGAAANVDVGAEETDSSAVYVAEFLRTFGELDISGLLLQERIGAEPNSDAEVAWYKPVINVCAHYRWDLGLQLPEAGGFVGPLGGVGFVIAPRPIDAAVAGVMTPANFWADGPPPPVPANGFRFAEIPADGIPEQVLERLALLRNA